MLCGECYVFFVKETYNKDWFGYDEKIIGMFSFHIKTTIYVYGVSMKLPIIN